MCYLFRMLNYKVVAVSERVLVLGITYLNVRATSSFLKQLTILELSQCAGAGQVDTLARTTRAYGIHIMP